MHKMSEISHHLSDPRVSPRMISSQVSACCRVVQAAFHVPGYRSAAAPHNHHLPTQSCKHQQAIFRPLMTTLNLNNPPQNNTPHRSRHCPGFAAIKKETGTIPYCCPDVDEVRKLPQQPTKTCTHTCDKTRETSSLSQRVQKP